MWRNANEWTKAGYIYDECDVVYIHEGSSSEIESFVNSGKKYGFKIIDELNIPENDINNIKSDKNDDIELLINDVESYFNDYFPLKEIFDTSEDYVEYIKNINRALSIINKRI